MKKLNQNTKSTGSNSPKSSSNRNQNTNSSSNSTSTRNYSAVISYIVRSEENETKLMVSASGRTSG
jgi:hypothetical protein